MLKQGLLRYNGKSSRKPLFILLPLLAVILLSMLFAPGCSSASEPTSTDYVSISSKPTNLSGDELNPPANSALIPDVGDGDFEAKVLKSNIPVLVHFYAVWAGPCRALAPVLENAASKYSGRLQFYRLDIDNNPNTPVNYQIRSIPTIIIINNGQLVDKAFGAMSSNALESFINKNIGAPTTTTTTTLPPTSTTTTALPLTTTTAAPTTPTPPPTTTAPETTYYRVFPFNNSQVSDEPDIFGEIKFFAFYYPPEKYAFCNGTLLKIADYDSLFQLVKNKFGGDGITTFAAPNLSQQMPQEGYMSYNICLNGMYPTGASSSNGTQLQYCPTKNTYDLYVGEVVLLKTNDAASLSNRLLPCDGRLCSISNHEALFSLLGTNFGGNGTNIFGLPDLRSMASPVEGASYYIAFGEIFPSRQ